MPWLVNIFRPYIIHHTSYVPRNQSCLRANLAQSWYFLCNFRQVLKVQLHTLFKEAKVTYKGLAVLHQRTPRGRRWTGVVFAPYVSRIIILCFLVISMAISMVVFLILIAKLLIPWCFTVKLLHFNCKVNNTMMFYGQTLTFKAISYFHMHIFRLNFPSIAS